MDVVRRVDGPDKVTGRARYAADVVCPGLVWGKVLRSPLAHARIVAIDTSRARALPGVQAVLTGADLPDVRVGRQMRDLPVLARERVRFVGEKVAAVAADDPGLAEQACRLIEVQYAELPAVFDPLEAMAEGAPTLHTDTHQRLPATARPAQVHNGVSHAIWGDSPAEVEAALAAADHVFERTFYVPLQHQGYLEPHLGSYKLPCVADVPPLEIVLLPPDTAAGIKPIGEGANCGIVAAIANAVAQVTGVCPSRYPILAEDVRALLRA